jgi:glycosyltransferase involved in cell wall biosynthesis
MSPPVVHLYAVCWDEADMLGFFFRHYDPWVNRYVIYDDDSTDGSREILRTHPKVELRDFTRVEANSFVLSHKAMQEEAWKESRGQADWVVVTAIDEHLHVKARPMADYLAEQTERGVTLIPALGFDMNHPTMPEDHGLLLTNIVTRGRPRAVFNKLSIFDPAAVRETGFHPGRHAAEPIGDLLLPVRDELMLWHYKHLGFERNAAREAAQAVRLGTEDVANGFGQHYHWTKEQRRAFWDEMEREAADLAADGFVPDHACVGPLWWQDRAGVTRADPARLPPLRATPARRCATPTVSVLIKAYNHAPYVRQTIESVLAQSFQDLEIVVTDDGSTDETLAILREFTDPCIRLEALPHNRGISAAMNATIARARGRYLAILNSDDWALPGRLRKQVAFLDANPDVSLVFGLPRPVDEDGLPTAAFNDFHLPLTFHDFSRRTWLRQFFFGANCLCAPTAMIRREAYEEVGGYDPRLANLQDFDMWIRMLVAGHNIHVMREKLTAFRIRANNANASAPSPESRLRSVYENGKILRHFAEFDQSLFEEVFGEEVGLPCDEPVAVRVAELARLIPGVHYQNFALELIYGLAKNPEDFSRLRNWGGSVDALNIRAVEERDSSIGELDRTAQSRDHAILNLTAVLAAREQTIADLTQAAATREQTIADLTQAAAAREQTIADLTQAAATREQTIADLTQAAAARDQTIADLTLAAAARDQMISDLTQAAATREQHLADIGSELSRREREIARLQSSFSWRSTAFIRWIGLTVKKVHLLLFSRAIGEA